MYQRTKEMIKDYKADMPLKEMVKKYNILANSIIQTMSRAGVKRPKEKFCRNVLKNITGSDIKNGIQIVINLKQKKRL